MDESPFYFKQMFLLNSLISLFSTYVVEQSGFFCNLDRATSLEEEKSEFKPVVLSLKIVLVSQPAHSGGFW